MERAIVAIGGGKIARRATVAIDREIIRLSNRAHPRILFIPTASSDSETYWNNFQKYFGGFLECRVEALFLTREKYTSAEIRKKIFAADIVYVGGGNTLMMMRLWRRLGVDRMLKAAYEKGIVMAGVSAGAICWFDSGHSDSMSFYDPDDWKYINVRGLGLIHGINCPHYDGMTLGVKRRHEFQGMIAKMGGMGIAIENNCAIEFIDDSYRVIRSNEKARAYRVYKSGGGLVSEAIPQQDGLAPVESLMRVG
jgi:dipeptidase E